MELCYSNNKTYISQVSWSMTFEENNELQFYVNNTKERYIEYFIQIFLYIFISDILCHCFLSFFLFNILWEKMELSKGLTIRAGLSMRDIMVTVKDPEAKILNQRQRGNLSLHLRSFRLGQYFHDAFNWCISTTKEYSSGSNTMHFIMYL